MFGSLQLAPTNYYNVSTSVGNVETRLLLLHLRWTYSTPVSFEIRNFTLNIGNTRKSLGQTVVS